MALYGCSFVSASHSSPPQIKHRANVNNFILIRKLLLLAALVVTQAFNGIYQSSGDMPQRSYTKLNASISDHFINVYFSIILDFLSFTFDISGYFNRTCLARGFSPIAFKYLPFLSTQTFTQNYKRHVKTSERFLAKLHSKSLRLTQEITSVFMEASYSLWWS